METIAGYTTNWELFVMLPLAALLAYAVTRRTAVRARRRLRDGDGGSDHVAGFDDPGPGRWALLCLALYPDLNAGLLGNDAADHGERSSGGRSTGHDGDFGGDFGGDGGGD